MNTKTTIILAKKFDYLNHGKNPVSCIAILSTHRSKGYGEPAVWSVSIIKCNYPLARTAENVFIY